MKETSTLQGTVTIGTAPTTDTLLDVLGESTLQGAVTIGTASTSTNLTVTGESTLYGKATIGTSSTTDTLLDVSGASNLQGSVSVGTDSTSTNLDVTGESILQGKVSIGTTSTTNTLLDVIGASTLKGVVTIGTSGEAGTNLMVYGATQSTSFYASSDYRIKENIEPLPESITVDQLKPISYTHKETNQKNIGFLAHEVQEVFSFLVEGTKDGPETQSLNYIGLIGILTKEIQDLKKRVKKLED